MLDIDTSPIPDIGNRSYTKEFHVGNMLPQVGSTEGLGTELSNKDIEDVLDDDEKIKSDFIFCNESKIDKDYTILTDNITITKSYGVFDYRNKYNAIVDISPDIRARGRSEILIIDKDKVYLSKSKKGLCGDYSIPGGGWDFKESHDLSAIREAEEEARLKSKNVKYMGCYLTLYDEPHKWVKTYVNKMYWWRGYYSEVYVGEYDGKYTGNIDDVDKDELIKTGKFYPIKDVINDLHPIHREAIENYLHSNYTESTADIDKDQYQVVTESSLSSNKYYFVSKSNMDGKSLKPRILENYLTRIGAEDNKTPRVCFSDSIGGCLTGLSMNIKDTDFYVHVPDGQYEFKTPSLQEVPDRDCTGEVWCTSKSVKLKCLGKIHVKDSYAKPMTYKYIGKNGDTKTAETYSWNWMWKEFKDKTITESAKNIFEPTSEDHKLFRKYMVYKKQLDSGKISKTEYDKKLKDDNITDYEKLFERELKKYKKAETRPEGKGKVIERRKVSDRQATVVVDKLEAEKVKRWYNICKTTDDYKEYKTYFNNICKFFKIPNTYVLGCVEVSSYKNERQVTLTFRKNCDDIDTSNKKLYHTSNVNNITRLNGSFRSKDGRFLFPEKRIYFGINNAVKRSADDKDEMAKYTYTPTSKINKISDAPEYEPGKEIAGFIRAEHLDVDKVKTEACENINESEDIIMIRRNDIVTEMFEDFFGESENIKSIPDEIEPIVKILENKGYDVKYASPGHANTTFNNDRNEDGIINGKFATTGRVIFARDYAFKNTPQGWEWKVLHNNAKALYVKPYTYNKKMGDEKTAFNKYQSFYISGLRDWAKALPKCGSDKKQVPDENFNN